MSQSLTELPPAASPSWRRFLVVAVLAAAVLRLAFPGGIAVEHFDEGVYASNHWCPGNPATDPVHLRHRYPDRHLYAPPLLPSAIEMLMLFVSRGRLVPFLVSLAAGLATVLLVGEVSRRWFGEPAARATVTLAVFSDVHILYSRTALTDVTWIAWLLLGVWLTQAAIAHGRPLVILAAGVAVGLGWWTKYTGWLPLAIGLAGIGGAVVFGRVGIDRLSGWLLRWLAVAIVAGATISPFVMALEPHGGYAAVLKHHRGYLTGIGGWASSLAAQSRAQWRFDSLLGLVGLGLAGWLASGRLLRFTWNTSPASVRPAGLPRLWVLSLVIAAVAAWLSSALMLSLLAIFGIVCLVTLQRTVRPPDELRDRLAAGSLAAWMLVAWWIGLTLVTPLYNPYPRLMLPWTIATWLLAGSAIAMFVRQPLDRPQPASAGRAATVPCIVVALVVLVAGITVRLGPQGVPAWQPRTAMVDVAEEVLDRVADVEISGMTVIGIWGQPAIFYQLHALTDLASRSIVVHPVSAPAVVVVDKPRHDIAVFLLARPQALLPGELSDPRWREFEPVGDPISIRPSSLVRLNEPAGRQDDPFEFRLYRWRPGQSAAGPGVVSPRRR